MTKRTAATTDPDLLPMSSTRDWEVVPESESVQAAPPLGAIISVRLGPATARLVRSAAHTEGITQSEFIRRSAIRAAEAVADREHVANGTGSADMTPGQSESRSPNNVS